MDQATDTPSPTSSTRPVPDIGELRSLLSTHFPHLWPAVEVGIATCATLLLADNVNPTAVILVGGASTGKTSVASMFEGATIDVNGKLEKLCYRSDKFTPASFVSQAANTTSNQLAKIDLLPKIKDKVLLTPELATIFRGKDEELEERFSTITRVLDGHGLQTDSGTHGHRGYAGPHLFAWLGCTTPFDLRVWKVMSQLGSRLFFLLMEAGPKVGVEQLLADGSGRSYATSLKATKTAVETFLRELFASYGGVQSVPWNDMADDAKAREWLARFATLLVAMRSVPIEERDATRRVVYRQGEREAPYRALAVLTNLARAHALACGRRQLTMDDVPRIAEMTVSTMPADPRVIFRELVKKNGELDVEDVKSVMGTRHADTARQRMRYLDATTVLEFEEKGNGKRAVLRLREEFAWCKSSEFRDLLGFAQPINSQGVCDASPPVTSGEVCVDLPSSRLVERQFDERKDLEGGPATHNPSGVTGCIEQQPELAHVD